MGKSKPANAGKEWTGAQEATLVRMAHQGSSTPAIANAVKRTESAVYNKASELKVSLNPPDKKR